MKRVLLLFFAGWTVVSAQALTFQSQLDQHGSSYANIWGYTDEAGREYALLCCVNGTAIVNVTDPAHPVEIDYIPAPNSSWHEVQVWGKYAYVVSEGGSGLQIINLSYLPDTAFLVKNWTVTNYNTTHSLHIRDGYAYLNGGNATSNRGVATSGGTKIVSLADPENPVELGNWGDAYVHDCFVRDDTMYAANLSSGYYIVDVHNKSAPQTIHHQTYTNQFTHNAALTDNGQHLLTTDEAYSGAFPFPGRLRVWDISTLRDGIPGNTNITQATEFGSGAIVHNVYAKGRYAYASYYTEGIRVWDISNPASLSLVGNYDTYAPDNSWSFTGAWGVYPFFPSGNIAVSDMVGGLFMLGFAGKETGNVTVTVVDTVTGLPIAGAKATLLQDNLTRVANASGEISATALSGVTRIKIASSGFDAQYQDVKIPVSGKIHARFALTRLQGTITGLNVTGDTTHATLTWNRTTNAMFAKYRIFSDTLPDAKKQIDSTSDVSDTVKTYGGLKKNKTHYFRIRGVDSLGFQTAFSQEVLIYLDAEPPAPAVTHLNYSEDTITVNWTLAEIGDFARYYLYLDTFALPSVPFDTITDRNVTESIIGGLRIGKTYYVRLRMEDTMGYLSPYSAQATITLTPKPFVLTTAIYQNPVLNRYLDIVVASGLPLSQVPFVRVLKTPDSANVSMTPLTGGENKIYVGSYELNGSGTYTVRTTALAVRGDDSIQTRILNAVLGKFNERTVIETPDRFAKASVEPGTLAGTVYLTASANDERVWNFGPEGTLAKPARIAVRFDANEFANPEGLSIWKRSGGDWIALPSEVITEEGTVQTSVTSFGEFKLVYDELASNPSRVIRSFELGQNFPNPFNPATVIVYDLPNAVGKVSLSVYNLLGQRVRTLFEGPQPAGHYEWLWDGRNDRGQVVASGVYLYRLETPNFRQTKKMIFLK